MNNYEIQSFFPLDQYLYNQEVSPRSYPPHYLKTLPTPRSNSYIRFANFTPTFPPIDVYLNGSIIASNLKFGEITNYYRVIPGKHLLSIYVANDRNNPFFATTITVPVADIISTFAFGFEDLSFYLISDDFRTLPDEVAVNFVHLSPNAPPLDLYIDGVLYFSAIYFKEATRYIVLDQKPLYNILLKIAGTDYTLINLPNMTLQPNNSYTFNVVGLYEGDPPLQIVTTLDGSTY
ncbi:uncharacterized protein DUF4397 [Natranaerovirga pectinivora]|uniref:Uncharacterized protein DUF4397 n=1 Tax=Natranaerovirga pectinivora TaxID=682400 RepID=A0A4R3MDK0_9FIRM|nr:DUF4397 domain-containing protein [Natranaerovirga pectinivora]TCT11631.1 uncharacterized protein DUF4397 [Natranaerovirga pectinivora]